MMFDAMGGPETVATSVNARCPDHPEDSNISFCQLPHHVHRACLTTVGAMNARVMCSDSMGKIGWVGASVEKEREEGKGRE